MPTELRCEGDQLYGILSDDHKTLEVRCRRRGCGYSKGIVILHTLLLETQQVINTRKFRDPKLP